MVEAAENRIGDNVPEPCRKRRIYGDCGNAVARQKGRHLRAKRIIAIERLKDATAIALRKGDNSFILAKARFLEAWIAYREIQKLVPQVMKKYEVKISHTDLDGDIVPVEIKALVEEPTEARDLGSNLQRVELTRQIVPRYFIIGSVTAVRDWPAEQFLPRRTRQAQFVFFHGSTPHKLNRRLAARCYFGNNVWFTRLKSASKFASVLSDNFGKN
jgi:hypothetical protein